MVRTICLKIRLEKMKPPSTNFPSFSSEVERIKILWLFLLVFFMLTFINLLSVGLKRLNLIYNSNTQLYVKTRNKKTVNKDMINSVFCFLNLNLAKTGEIQITFGNKLRPAKNNFC